MTPAAEYISPGTAAKLCRALPYHHRLLVELMECTGLRVGDAVQLQPEDIAEALTHRGWLLVCEQKTGKHRRIRLPAELLHRLAAYSGQNWVFESPKNPQKHLTRQAVNKMLKDRAWQLRLRQQVSPHGLRKQYAVQLLAKTGSLPKVQRALGHEDVGTTALYALADKLGTGKGKKR